MSRIDAVSRITDTPASPAPEGSASEVAKHAAEAAVRAADAALVAANAAILAANAAVRLVDEHDHKLIVLGPRRVPPRTQPALPTHPKVIHLPATSELRLPAPSELRLPASSGVPAQAPPASRGRGLRALAVGLITAGSLAMLDGIVTLVWQEPISALYTTLRQDHLSSALRRAERAPPTATERQALQSIGQQSQRIAYLASALQRQAGNGSPVARIRIPRIGASFVVVNGTSTSALQSGPGIYPETVYPGIAGTTAIAGHRTTYLAPFRHIDSLRRGNRILLHMPYADFTYTVIGKRVVPPTDVHAAVANVGYPRLVLSACTPLYSAAKRLLVFARLARTVAAGAGRLPLPALPPAAVPAALKRRPA
ncbi:MAG: class E sortase [Actinobacteria bacterium]|nr:MAG: class E sortase [Actinomycetota bacterium]